MDRSSVRYTSVAIAGLPRLDHNYILPSICIAIHVHQSSQPWTPCNLDTRAIQNSTYTIDLSNNSNRMDVFGKAQHCIRVVQLNAVFFLVLILELYSELLPPYYRTLAGPPNNHRHIVTPGDSNPYAQCSCASEVEQRMIRRSAN
jgi:hypothetical protein